MKKVPLNLKENLMINFSDRFILKGIFDIDKNSHHLDILRKKRFRVSDTLLSYRQINSLEASDVLNNTRTNEKGWRLFSLKDLIYLTMVFECRKYGIKNEQLKELKADFYTSTMEKETLFRSDKLIWGELALFSVLMGNRVMWLLFPNSKSMFCDNEGYMMLNGWDEPSCSLFQINVNEILKKVLENVKNEEYIKRYIKPKPLVDINAYYASLGLTEKQIQLLNIIEKNEHESVKIKKKDNTYIIYGKSTKPVGSLTAGELANMFLSKDFSNIEVQRRNGKIVSYSFEDVYKV